MCVWLVYVYDFAKSAVVNSNFLPICLGVCAGNILFHDIADFREKKILSKKILFLPKKYFFGDQKKKFTP